MEVIDFVVGKIVDKYGLKSKYFITEKDEFLKAFAIEYNVIIKQSSERPNMITNPQILTSSIDFSNITELQKAITKSLFTKLYTNNMISKSEMEDLCKQNL